HTRLVSDWSSDVCSSDLMRRALLPLVLLGAPALAADTDTPTTDPGEGWGTPMVEGTPLAGADAAREKGQMVTGLRLAEQAVAEGDGRGAGRGRGERRGDG